MKKNIIFLMFAIAGLLFAGVQNVNAQIYGEDHVTFGWNDGNCDCSEPLTKLVRVVITTYPGGSPVDDTNWYTPHYNPETYDGDVNLDDCEEACYTVTVYIAYSDNSGTCCTGSASANVTGYQLFSTYVFPNDIIMN